MELMINSHPDLEGVLTRRTAAKLKVLSKGYYVKGTSQMNKAALVCAVTDALKEPDRLSELLLVVDPQTYTLFRRASESPDPIKVKDPGSEQYRLLDDFCYLVCADTPDGLVVSVPTQIRAAFEQLKNDGFLKQKDRFDLLHNYAMAAIHLYLYMLERYPDILLVVIYPTEISSTVVSVYESVSKL